MVRKRGFSLQRYFVNTNPETNRFTINGDDYHHIARVMRMKSGETIVCVTKEGKSAVCQIAEITDEQVVANVVKWEDETTELPIKVSIASGLPKGDKLEWIIQKGTELGATDFVPFLASRSIVKWDEKKAKKRLNGGKKLPKRQRNNPIAARYRKFFLQST